ncbi:VMAP-C domain-containing protein [Streptomyces sp. NPDC002851]
MSTPQGPHGAQVRLLAVLVQELTALESLRDAQQRSLFIQLVGDDLGIPLGENGLPVRAELAALLKTVLLQERGYEALLQAVGVLEGEDIAGDLAHRAMRALNGVQTPGAVALPPVFDQHVAQAARKLLAAGPVDRSSLLWTLSHELRLSLPEGLSAVELFDFLLDANAQADRLPPAVVLVEVVAALGSPQAEALRAWSDAWAQAAGETDALLDRRAEIVKWPAPDPSVPRALVVMVDPAADGTDRIFVRHWVNASVGFWQPLASDVEHATLDTLADAVGRAVRRAESHWADADAPDDGPEDGPVHLEFLLPHALFNHDVARLELGDQGRDPLPVGLRYFVHLRSLERMRRRDPAQLRRWRRRWQTFRSASAAEAYRWSGPEGGGVRPLTRWRASLAQEARITAVILQRPALPGDGLDALAVAIDEGVGLAAWDRRDDAPGPVVEVLQLLFGHPPAQLPAKVNQLRILAETDDAAPLLAGSHLAILWDDPNRLVDCDEEMSA